MKKLPPIAYIAIALFTLAIFKSLFGFISTLSQLPICDAANSLLRISCGEEILLNPPGGLPRRDKKEGFDAIANRDYSQAIEALERDWQVYKDPETLIALNNARLANLPADKIKTIAVVVPSNNTPIFVATNILKGVAEAQREWNKANNSWALRVIIADDSNDVERGKKIAEKLVDLSNILAVFGHYSSNTTVNVKDIYQRGKVVLISPTSTSDKLSSQDTDNWFFRVVSSNRVSAKLMADKWANQYDKIGLFYTPKKEFSESLRTAFLQQISANRVVAEFDLTISNNAAQEIAQAKAAGAKAIALFPDAYTDPIERDRVLSIIKANQGQLPILGNSILQDAYLFQVPPQNLKNLVISVPVQSEDGYIDRGRLNRAPNWWGEKSQIHERIINSYDAMQVLLSALDKANNREEVREVLANPNFHVFGLTGKISFNGSDRAQNINSLTTPKCTDNKCQGFQIWR
jgi:branched-chain amino acid transport system substrate-binding protein